MMLTVFCQHNYDLNQRLIYNHGALVCYLGTQSRSTQPVHGGHWNSMLMECLLGARWLHSCQVCVCCVVCLKSCQQILIFQLPFSSYICHNFEACRSDAHPAQVLLQNIFVSLLWVIWLLLTIFQFSTEDLFG